MLLVALGVILPNVALACMPQNPYFYMVRGAYLLAFLGLVIALTLELFRYLVQTVSTRVLLRRGALLFVFLTLMLFLIGGVYNALEQSWQVEQYPVPAGGSGQRC